MKRPAESAIDVRAIGVDEWPLWRDLRLEALREAPAASGSALAEWQGEGDTETRWRARLSTVPFNAVAYLAGVPAGMASGTALDEDGTSELISMWVAPFARGHGVGDALIAAVIRRAREEGARTLALDVVEGNESARTLYLRCGFVDAGPADCSASGAPERRMVRPIMPT
jgi:GNAT superfamily N-acetyltransferase